MNRVTAIPAIGSPSRKPSDTATRPARARTRLAPPAGATGQLGSLIVASLLERFPAEEVGVSVRDPGRAADLVERGVRVRRGDFSEPDSLAGAFEATAT
jgi:anti-sigma factor RsiW